MVFDVSNVPHFLTDSGVVTAGLGALLLAFGRRLYFLLLGTVGFVVGLWLSTTPPVAALGLDAGPEARLAIAAGLGVVSAALAFVVHRLALGAAGLAIGGVGGWWLAQVSNGGIEGWAWLWPAGGALAGALLLPALYQAALVVLSAWVGSALVVQSLPLEGPAAAVVALGLLGVGILFQAAAGRRGRRRERQGPRRGPARRRSERTNRPTEAAPVT